MTTNRPVTYRRTPLRLRRSSAAIAASAVLLLAGCDVPTLEEQLLRRFFDASRTYDRVALAKVAVPGLVYNPVTEGVVADFSVVDVSGEGDERTVLVDAEVVAEGAARRQLLEAAMARGDRGWRITAITPLPVSRIAP